MTGTVFGIVLLAAFLHALWNAVVKGGADKVVAMTAVVFGQGLAGLACLAVAPTPALASLPWLALGVALHLGYQIFLASAYRLGDMTQVYPIARGVAPLIVTAASALFLGVSFERMELAAIAIIAIGIASISMVRSADGLFQGKAALLALTTGGFIAAYSLADGIGARIAGTSLGFYGWMAVLNAVVLAGLARMMRPGLTTKALAQTRTLVIGGGASFAAYALVVYAFTQAPIALVTALRETSIVFALLIGVLVLKEPLNLLKVIATATTLTGAALLRFAR
ncbi:EamA family transporter [Roseovarius sp. 2305UL8-3]|uniref:EamA family transporter n=1 Tax=Roseovarius conchicola TaxID=3121636 RepID=UPI003526F51C